MNPPSGFVGALFVPGDRPERFAKARAAAADPVVIDLEDAVAPAAKAVAREAAGRAIDEGFAAFVRINAVPTPAGRDDLRLLASRRPLGLVVPKTASAQEIATVRAACPGASLVALLESVEGFARLEEIAGAGVAAVAFGAYDFAAELGAAAIPEVLAPWRARLVFEARRAGVAAIDAPHLALADEPGLRDAARRAVAFGFDGMFAIHPGQLPAIRGAFTPDAGEVAEARAVLAAQRSGGVAVHEGRMIDEPVARAARRTLLRAERTRGQLGPLPES